MSASQGLERSVEDFTNPFVTLSGHENLVNNIAWLADDRIVTGSFGETLRIWNLTNGKQEGTSMVHRTPVRSIVATKDGRIISCSSLDEHIRVWNVATQQLIIELSLGEDNRSAYCIFLFENGREKFLVSCHRNWIVLWEMAETIRFRSHVKTQSTNEFLNDITIEGCFFPNSKKLATCYERTILVVLDVENGEISGRLEAESSWMGISTIIWSPDGDTVLIGCWDGSIRFWDPSTDNGKVIGKPWTTGHQNSISCLSLSPDGKWLASASLRETICFWDMKSGDLVGKPLYHGTAIHAIAFSRTGEFLACGDEGGHILVWRVPWWNKADRLGLDLLDLSAVAPPDGPSSIPREPDLDFLNDRQTENTSTDPPHARHSALSWRWWKKLPRLVLGRSNPIYMAGAITRVYVASRDSPRSRSQQVPSSPEHQAGTTGETRTSSEDSSDESSTDTPQDDPAVNQVGCCGLLLSRRQPKAIAAQKQHDVAVGPSPPTTPEIAPPVLPSARPAPQDILELSAIVPS